MAFSCAASSASAVRPDVVEMTNMGVIQRRRKSPNWAQALAELLGGGFHGEVAR